MTVTAPKDYVMSVSRLYAHTGEVTVSAFTEEEAKAKTLEIIGDVDLKLGECADQYDFVEVIGIEEPASPGEGNADGVSCPQCGHSDALEVGVAVFARLTGDGCSVLEACGPNLPNWNDESAARCMECGWQGKASELVGIEK